MSKLTQKITASLLACLQFLALAPVSFGAEFEPYQDTFIISAYYSPCPDQTVYFRGSYDADRRLNGNGTNGADGTQVYPGMLAAPKSYSFGTKLEIPGLGVGTVHDRGGAIVTAGERGNTNDRIDVWMGRCEEGLARALNWGMRRVSATVYPPSYALADNFNLPGFNPKFVAELKIGDSGDAVRALQEELKTYGYYREAISGNFDENTKKALLGYQLARRIVASAETPGAGTLGPTTREKLNSEVFKRSWQTPKSLLSASVIQSGGGVTSSPKAAANARFPVTLSKGDRGDRVRELQIALATTGYYDCEINGMYDENLENCIFKFQQEQNILQNRDEFGAGFFGEQTRTRLAAVLTEQENQLNRVVASELPGATLQPGDSGEKVSQMQAGLNKLGYLKGEPTGSYNPETVSALAKFQVAENILTSETSYGAGWFGAKTKAVFESKLRDNLLAMPALPENPKFNRQTVIAFTPQFEENLAPGDSGDAVKNLQATLKELGHFIAEPTGNYGSETIAAVLAFQLEAKIVNSQNDPGAGFLGPKTRTALNAAVSREKVALTKTIPAS